MIKRYARYFVLLTIIFWLTMSSSFSQKTQPHIIRGLRQFKNSDWNTSIEKSMNNPGGSQETPEDHLKIHQQFYNYHLQILLWKYRLAIDDDWMKGNLDMSGLQKLEWVVKTNKTIYQPGEPVGIRVSLRNISPEEVAIRGTLGTTGFVLSSMLITKVWKDEKQEVYMTKYGCLSDGSFYGIYNGQFRSSGGGVLQLGDMVNVSLPFQTLNLYYDLSQPGEYELTFYTRNFLGSDDEQIGEYPKPCTIRFKIEGNTNWLDSQVVWPEEDK